MSYPGVALVTGAGSGKQCNHSMIQSSCKPLGLTRCFMTIGIGRATARLFAKEGCSKIVIADLNKDALEETKKGIETENKEKIDILAVPTGKFSRR